MSDISKYFPHVNEDTKIWLKTATISEIALAIELGKPSVMRIQQALRPQISVNKGKIGEEYVERILSGEFSNITNVSKIQKSGDLTLYFEHKKITIEVKNYSRSVPSSEVEKFQRDLATANSSGGVFISIGNPITNITESFALRWESVDGKRIPCAYVCVDNIEKCENTSANLIIASVKMISQLISAHEQLLATYAEDTVTTNMYEITQSIDGISKVRYDLQQFIGTITSGLIKTTTGMALAESSILQSVNQIKNTLNNEIILYVDVLPNLEKNHNYCGYSPERKEHIKKICAIVNNRAPKCDKLFENLWNISATKYAHECGIGFQFTAKQVEVFMPRSLINKNMYDQLLACENLAMGKNNINIVLTHVTFDIISQIILGEQII